MSVRFLDRIRHVESVVWGLKGEELRESGHSALCEQISNWGGG
jgi:hypothetical protein